MAVAAVSLSMSVEQNADATAKYLTALLYKSPDEIRSEIAKLSVNDAELEHEREQIALTNHRHLVHSITKLDLVKNKTRIASDMLRQIPQSAPNVTDLLQEAKRITHDFLQIKALCDEVEQKQELIEEVTYCY
eukprot:Gregarina_sp_Poly_1__9725@NODE_618_length_7121_cov_156_723845_g474_i0_p6_GENE_NODE_618_length_7121_cov_156_723845_g474_i0NODE_618_length_7121_cov_156_723845_g474_i0_p6_ORF_typecomplete_len133_score26_27SKA2/PF16740_5/6_6SKA2/PF16740_5/5_1e05Dor1/PF04124_12/0_0014Wbp11/PF09429_10/0_41zfC4H2/PF10146_9/0_6_NODE_618_length_7121_cov_156_723845_g474_i030863484